MSGFVPAPLGELAKFINGDRGANYPSKSDFTDEGIPFINAGHLVGGGVDFSSMNYISEDKFDRLGSGKTKANDILYCLRGSLGKTAIVNHTGHAAIASSLVIIRPGAECAVEYLYRYLTSPFGEAEIRRFDNGSSQPNLSAASVKKYQIPLPPLEEQKRIAGILDAADALRVKRRESLAELDTLLQSVFLDMFGDPVTNPKRWERRPIKETKASVQIGPFGSLLHKADYVVGGVPLINPMHIVNGRIQVGEEQTVSEEKAATLSGYRLETGDVVMGRRGEMGRCAIVSDSEAGMLCGTGSLYFRPDPGELTSLFLALTLSSRSMKSHLEGLAQGVTMPNLNRTMIGNLKIVVPPLDLQRLFGVIVESIERQKVRLRTHLDELDTLFATLQSRAFNGEL